MDYKNTLNLPRTDFAMKADLVTREPARLAKWEQEKLYEQIQAARADAPAFVLHDGPPFANGDVHVGTAFNKILKDFVVKSKTLRGFRAPYVPGWDCHGLPIESKVTQELRAAGKTDADAATIRSACDAYARKYIDLQRQQFRRLGILGDWEHPYLTLDKQYEADELRMFADIVEKGFVYRGKKPVYWSIPFRTALAEAEVEYRDHVSQSVFVKFRLKGEPNTFLLIWTTTPWTLPANLAVAFNPGHYYAMVFANGGSFLVANALLSQVAEKCGWGGYQIVRTVHADELAQLEYEHPFCARTGRLFPADFVDNSTGTGFVHIAPGHGLEDYQLGRSVGLPIYSPVDDNGAFIHTDDLPIEQQMPAHMLGKSTLEKNGRSDANEVVLAELKSREALAHQEDYPHSYPHCWRSKTPIIFRAMDQWFIRIDHQLSATADATSANASTFRHHALAAIDAVRWIPDWGVNRIKGAVESRPDWCISRQRTWGVPLPAFYDAAKNPILDAGVIRRVADLIEQHGSNVWFASTAAELWSQCRPADWSGPDAATKGNDTLDVWIDSGSSSRAVLMRRPELLHSALRTPHSALDWPSDMYLEGSDQHRGWFQSSLLLSLAGNGAAPYKSVLTHGFMVKASKADPKQKEKVSKSAQATYEKPETADRYIKEFGADVLRLWVASQDWRNDIWVGDDRLQKVSETYRLIRNSLRYQLSNLYDFDPAKHAVPDEKLTQLDRWVLGEFARLEQAVAAAYDAYEFHEVYQRVSQFVSVELSRIYHDAVKDRLYTDPANSARRRSTQTALHRMITRLCQMLSPLLAFTADEAWEFIPGVKGSVHGREWKPSAESADKDQLNGESAAWLEMFRRRDEVLVQLEQARQAKRIGKALDAGVELRGNADSDPGLKIIERHRAEFQELLNVSELKLSIRPVTDAGGAIKVVPASELGRSRCERCWHWELDVGANAEHPTICGRCVEAVKQAAT